MKKRVIMMSLSGVYEEQGLWEELQQESKALADREELLTLPGTDCYCDEEAAAYLRACLECYPLEGIHFLDSGNYHYLSLFWLEKWRTPYRLVMVDHHTDLQPPAFGGLLSCGGWLLEVLENQPYVEQVLLIGPPASSLREAGLPNASKKVQMICEEELTEEFCAETNPVLQQFLSGEAPLYLSLDKDVLSRQELPVNWDQGVMSLQQLQTILKELCKTGRLLGADICGEEEPGKGDPKRGRKSNLFLLRCLLNGME